MLIQIIYVSSMVVNYTKDEISDLCKRFSDMNATHGVTGVLFYNDGNVIQYIEGEEDSINRLYANILKDPHHRGVITLVKNFVKERNFDKWSMKFIDTDFVDIIKIVCSLDKEKFSSIV